MSEETTTTPTWKKWVIGIGMIITALSGWLVAYFDGDDSTKPDTAATISSVQSGVSYIQNGATTE